MKNQVFLLMKIISSRRKVCISQANSPLSQGNRVSCQKVFQIVKRFYCCLFFFSFFFSFLQPFNTSQFEAAYHRFCMGVLQTVRLLFHNQEWLLINWCFWPCFKLHQYSSYNPYKNKIKLYIWVQNKMVLHLLKVQCPYIIATEYKHNFQVGP